MVGLGLDLTGMGDFLNLWWDKARTRRANEEIKIEMEMRMIATFMMTMFSSTGL
jgi:hypothetical protein